MCRKSTTWDKRLYFPSEGRRAEDLIALKNPTASAGFEPANLDTKGQHATSRPPKPLLAVMVGLSSCLECALLVTGNISASANGVAPKCRRPPIALSKHKTIVLIETRVSRENRA